MAEGSRNTMEKRSRITPKRKGVWRKFRRRLSRGVWEARLLHQVALSQLPATLDPTGVDEVRLTLRNLHSREAVQLILFQDEALERRARLAAALTRVRHHYGLLSIGPVTELAGPRERLAEAVWRLEGSWS